MNALLLRSSIVLAAAFVAAGAHADHKLFPTDVLAEGQFDALGEFSRVDSEYTDGRVGKLTTDALALGLRAGIGTHTHLGLSVAMSDSTLKAPGMSGSADATAVGLSVRHALMADKAYSLVIDGSVERADADVGDAATTYTVGATAGWTLTSGLRPYASAHLALPDNDGSATSWALQGGVWMPLSPSVTLIPAVTYAHRNSEGGSPSASTLGVSLSGLIQLGGNTYLRPSVAYANSDDDSAEATALSISLYHQF